MKILNGTILLTHFCTLDSKCWAENEKHAKEAASKTWTVAGKKVTPLLCCQLTKHTHQELKARGKISVPPISVIFNFSCRTTRAATEAITGFKKLSTIAWDKGNIWMLWFTIINNTSEIKGYNTHFCYQ